MKRIVAGIGAFLCATSACLSTAATKELAIHYWPLQDGSSWSMPIPDENPNWVVNFTVSKVVQNSPGVSDVDVAYTLNGNQVQKEVYEVTANAIARVRGGANAGSDFNPPMPVLEVPMKNGATWSWKGTVGAGLLQQQASAQFTVSGPVEVTTPAGKFSAMRVHSALVVGSGKSAISVPNDSWYASGVGIVEQRATLNGIVHTYYLSKYTVK